MASLPAILELWRKKLGRTLVRIEVVDHKDQRYETAGDWFVDPSDGSISIRVSNTGSDADAILIGVHELVEAVLCKAHGIGEEEVDEFDAAFNASNDLAEAEPGEDVAAPYFREHAAADIVERFVALQMRVPWVEYSARVDSLFAKEEMK